MKLNSDHEGTMRNSDHSPIKVLRKNQTAVQSIEKKGDGDEEYENLKDQII